MNIPNNEGKACDAVVRYLEKNTVETRKNIRHPEKDGVGPPVDLRLMLGAQEYVIEHTRIESFENQIKTEIKTSDAFRQIYEYITEQISDSLPGPACYQLNVPVSVRLPGRKKKRDRVKHERVLNNLVTWIRMSVHCMDEWDASQPGPIPTTIWGDVCIKGTPLEFGCEIELFRWPKATLIERKPASIVIRAITQDIDELEGPRFKRLQRAYNDKCPKLKRCKDDGARTVLVLESFDSVYTSIDEIGRHLPALLAERADVPDEIYLVQTDMSLWWVFPIKRDSGHWPNKGMPIRGQPIYEEDKLPTAGMPKWYRDALGLDELYTSHPRGWVPATFNLHELDDLTQDCGSKKL